MQPPAINYDLMHAAKADAARSVRYAHHDREWELLHGGLLVRLLSRWRRVRQRRPVSHPASRGQRTLDMSSTARLASNSPDS
jgi:hypothetical protein